MSRQYAWLISGLMLCACSQSPTTSSGTTGNLGTTDATGGGGGGSTSASTGTGTTAPSSGASTAAGSPDTGMASTTPAGGGGGTSATAMPSASPSTAPSASAMPSASPTVGSAMTSGLMAPEDYLQDLAMDNQGEIALGQLALQKSEDAGVRNFAQLMVTDHSAAAPKVQAVADQEGLTLAMAPTPEQQAEMTKLQGLTGWYFDHEYMAFNVNGHQKDVDATQAQAFRGADPAVSNLASQLLPTLQSHLQLASNLLVQLNGNQ